MRLYGRKLGRLTDISGTGGWDKILTPGVALAPGLTFLHINATDELYEVSQYTGISVRWDSVSPGSRNLHINRP